MTWLYQPLPKIMVAAAATWILATAGCAHRRYERHDDYAREYYAGSEEGGRQGGFDRGGHGEHGCKHKRKSCRGEQKHHGCGGDHGGKGGGCLIKRMHRMMALVNATEQQKMALHDLFVAKHEERAKGRAAKKELFEALATALAADPIDQRAIEGVKEKAREAAVQQSNGMIETMVKAAALLTPEQRAQLRKEKSQYRCGGCGGDDSEKAGDDEKKE